MQTLHEITLDLKKIVLQQFLADKSDLTQVYAIVLFIALLHKTRKHVLCGNKHMADLICVTNPKLK